MYVGAGISKRLAISSRFVDIAKLPFGVDAAVAFA
jgi:hypothetical protein